MEDTNSEEEADNDPQEQGDHYHNSFELEYENFEKLVESRSLSGHSSFQKISTQEAGEIVIKFYLERGLLLSQHLYLSFIITQPPRRTFSAEVRTSIKKADGFGYRVRESTSKCSSTKAGYVTLGTVPAILREADIRSGTLAIRVQVHLFPE